MSYAVYDSPQTVFMLSLSSNALFYQSAPPPDLQSAINTYLRGYQPPKPGPAPAISPFFDLMNRPNANFPTLAGGDWSAVWGPKVYVASLFDKPINAGATNMIYVAHSPSLNMYVVAIAGTNPTGWSAAVVQDLYVGPANMVSWPPTTKSDGTLKWTPISDPAPTQPAIDSGTAHGLDALYNAVCPYTGVTLMNFLNAVPQSGQTLVFTGHSLGGALSPSLAMLLYPMAADKKYMPPLDAPNPNKSQWANVYILATAGPTPGNKAFAEQFFTPAVPDPIVPFDPAPIPVSYPPTLLSLDGVSGPYMPVATGVPVPNATTPGPGGWPLLYWNMNYANVYDVVPRAWTNLAGMIRLGLKPLSDPYTVFFADGAELPVEVGAPLGVTLNNLMAKAGYPSGGTITPYYAQCLMHFPINGVWGLWEQGQPYPQAFTPGAPPPQVTSLKDLFGWVLNAHLGQYGQALLGYPCLGLNQTPPTG